MGLNQLAPADGAFYIYANVEHLTDNSLAFAKKILQETHIAVTPGVDFDPINGHKYIRFSFAGSEKTMRNAMIRLEKFLKS
jgi:aspartate/methionine/tyrosine aminotransferase